MGNYLVVGGTSGIGLEIAKRLHDAGNLVVVLARQQRELITAPGLDFISWDATQDEVPALPFESLEGVAYCPGTILLKPFHRITDAEFLLDYQINALGAARMLSAVSPLLKKGNKPAVVLFSTVAVQTGLPFHASIAMAKGAVEGLTRSLAAEWAPTIRVNALAPSLTQTPLADKLTSTPEKIEAGGKRHPLGRIGQPNDIAEAALFLLSDKSSWITGQIIAVDGGLGSLKIN